MSTAVSKILTYYFFSKYITPPTLMFSWEIYEYFRSSHRIFFTKKAVLKNFAIFTEKLQACNFIKSRIQHRCFPLNMVKVLRTPILKNSCSVSSCFCMTLLLSSGNLLTGYEQLSY